jgi:hypothetical protein
MFYHSSKNSCSSLLGSPSLCNMVSTQRYMCRYKSNIQNMNIVTTLSHSSCLAIWLKCAAMILSEFLCLVSYGYFEDDVFSPTLITPLQRACESVYCLSFRNQPGTKILYVWKYLWWNNTFHLWKLSFLLVTSLPLSATSLCYCH